MRGRPDQVSPRKAARAAKVALIGKSGAESKENLISKKTLTVLTPDPYLGAILRRMRRRGGLAGQFGKFPKGVPAGVPIKVLARGLARGLQGTGRELKA